MVTFFAGIAFPQSVTLVFCCKTILEPSIFGSVIFAERLKLFKSNPAIKIIAADFKFIILKSKIRAQDEISTHIKSSLNGSKIDVSE